MRKQPVLTAIEFENLKSQFVTSSWGGIRKLPYAFTEQGVAMLSGVLNSETAIRVLIQIIRVFAKMRELLLTNKDILLHPDSYREEKMERKLTGHDEDIVLIFKYLKQLLTPPSTPRNKIGFKRKNSSYMKKPLRQSGRKGLSASY